MDLLLVSFLPLPHLYHLTPFFSLYPHFEDFIHTIFFPSYSSRPFPTYIQNVLCSSDILSLLHFPALWDVHTTGFLPARTLCFPALSPNFLTPRLHQTPYEHKGPDSQTCKVNTLISLSLLHCILPDNHLTLPSLSQSLENSIYTTRLRPTKSLSLFPIPHFHQPITCFHPLPPPPPPFKKVHATFF